MSTPLRVLVVVLIYVIATVVMTWPYVNWAALGSAIYPGDARLIAWTLAWNNHALLDGLPLFDVNIFYPEPGALVYNDPNIGISLFTLPLYAATGNPILAYNVVHVLTFLLNGLVMHLLVFRLTRSHLAGVVGGFTFAFSFYMMLHGHGHLTIIWAWLLPLSLVLLDRWIERPTWTRVLVWGFALLLQVFSAWYLGVITLIANGVVLLWYAFGPARAQWRVRLLQLVVVAMVSAAALWPLAMPYRSSIEMPTTVEARSFSADWASYFVPPLNTLAGQWWSAHIDRTPRWIWGESTLFLGWVATACAFVGVIAASRTGQWRRVGVYAAMVLIGGALSFGPSLEGEWPRAFDLLRMLPGSSSMRAPARFAVLVLFGTAVFAAYAVADLQRRFGVRAVACVGALIPVMLMEWFVVGFPAGKPQPVDVPSVYRHPAVLSARAIVSLPDYTDTDRWHKGADYLLYSTAHWRPIVNGFGRTEPAGHPIVRSHMRAFPGPNNARTMRRLGIDVVMLHADAYGAEGPIIISTAIETGEYDLVAQEGAIFVFRVKPEEP